MVLTGLWGPQKEGSAGHIHQKKPLFVETVTLAVALSCPWVGPWLPDFLVFLVGLLTTSQH